jgi:hypothetical protein
MPDGFHIRKIREEVELIKRLDHERVISDSECVNGFGMKIFVLLMN